MKIKVRKITLDKNENFVYNYNVRDNTSESADFLTGDFPL